MDLESYGGRRFLLSLLSCISSTALVYLAKISGDVYSVIQIATVAAYITGNVTEKVTQIKQTTENQDGPTKS